MVSRVERMRSDGGEQVEGDQVIYLLAHRLALFPQSGGHGRKTTGHIDQKILHGGHIGLLAADAGLGAASTPGGLLALITKHFFLHGKAPLLKLLENDHQQHFEGFFSIDCMGMVGRHDDGLAFL